MFTQEESATCRHCRRRVLVSRSTAGELLCWAGAAAWGFFIALPGLVAVLDATRATGTAPRPDDWIVALLAFGFWFALGVLPVVGLALAGQHGMQSSLLDRLFAAYFTEGRDTGSAEVLYDIGLAAGLPKPEIESALAEDSPIGTTLAEDFLARRQGINGVPYFVFNGRFGLSGAQEPEALYHMLDLAREDDALVRV